MCISEAIFTPAMMINFRPSYANPCNRDWTGSWVGGGGGGGLGRGSRGLYNELTIP